VCYRFYASPLRRRVLALEDAVGDGRQQLVAAHTVSAQAERRLYSPPIRAAEPVDTHHDPG